MLERMRKRVARAEERRRWSPALFAVGGSGARVNRLGVSRRVRAAAGAALVADEIAQVLDLAQRPVPQSCSLTRRRPRRSHFVIV